MQNMLHEILNMLLCEKIGFILKRKNENIDAFKKLEELSDYLGNLQMR